MKRSRFPVVQMCASLLILAVTAPAVDADAPLERSGASPAASYVSVVQASHAVLPMAHMLPAPPRIPTDTLPGVHSATRLAAVPQPAPAPTAPADLLATVQLGESLRQLYTQHGAPWVVAYQNSIAYWTYSVDGDNAWMAVGIAGNKVQSVQLIAKAYKHSSLSDGAHISLGDSSEAVTLLAPRAKVNSSASVTEVPEPHGVKRIYGIDKNGHIDRVGLTLNDETMPALIRYYEFTGWSPDRAIALISYGGSAAGEQRYLSDLRGKTPELNFDCVGGNVWTVVSHKVIQVVGLPLDQVIARCGVSRYKRAFYFSKTSQQVRAFDGDVMSQRALASAGVRDNTVLRALSAIRSRATPRVIATQIWFTTPNGTRWPGGQLDPTFKMTFDPNASPPPTVTAAYLTGGSAPRLLIRPGTSSTTKAVPNLSARAQPLVGSACATNYFGGFATGKCPQAPSLPAPPCPSLQTSDGAAATSCQLVGDPNGFPHPSPNDGTNGKTGCPIYSVSGKLWYKGDDFKLSGPFGLLFNHRYDSDFATYQGDLGIGWRHAYGAYLDLTNLSIGGVTLVDSDCNREYFGTVGTGTTVYDQFSGGSLTDSGTGFTVVTWDHRTLGFDTSGRLLLLKDRVGNTQTIARDAQNRISTVTDVLGRKISYGYDTKNRINSVTSTPSQITMTLTYDTGTNCFTGDLCSVKESDGNTWTYQYYDPSTMGGNHLLETVLDPLGHVEESNQYQLINLGNLDNHYRATYQQMDSGKNAYTFAYSPGKTVITNAIIPSEVTTYTWDQGLQQVLSISGPLCHCNGNAISYTYDLFGRVQTISHANILVHSESYGRDKIFTSPDGLTSYVSTAYPSVTDSYDYNISTTQGPQTRHIQYVYYPIGDPRSDLPNQILEPSVDTPGKTVTTTLTYGTVGLLTSIARQGYINGASTTYTTSYGYDTSNRGRLTAITGPRTDVTQQTTLAYYPDTDTDLARRGQLDTVSTFVTSSLSLVSTFAKSSLPAPFNTYNLYGDPNSFVDPNGVISEMMYDQRGRVVKKTLKGVTGDTTDLVTSLGYDAAGRLVTLSKPLGNGVTMGYDNANNLTGIIVFDASGNQRDQLAWSYDAMSQLSSESRQSCSAPSLACLNWVTQASETYSYTALGNLGAVTYPTGGGATLNWDSGGNLLSSVVGDSSYGVNTGYQYDLAHNTTQVGLGSLQFAASLYTHDLQDNLDTVTERLTSSATTAYLYDDFGRIRKETSPYEGVRVFGYDPAGNLISYTDGNGATTTTTYDALNRPLNSVSTRGTSNETLAWAYDNAASGAFGLGRLSKSTDPTGSKTYTYERRGNVASCVQVANAGSYTTTYVYDGNGNRSSTTLPSTRVLSYTFDYADRPYSVAGKLGSLVTTYVSSATYEPFGPRAVTIFGNGSTQALTYNQRYLPAENKLSVGSNILSDVTYNENAVGYVTQITDTLSATFNKTLSYGGHATNMLTDANTGTGLWGQAHYADQYAQIITTAQFPGHKLGFKLSQGTSQLTSVFNQDTGTVTPVSFDAAGNESSVGSATYTYSPRNYLASGDGITYTYDSLGQRVTAATTIPVTGSVTRISLYGPGRHLQMESSLTSIAVAYDYIWLGDTPVAEEDIANAKTYWMATDHIGAPTILTSAAGMVAWQADYEPFGAIYHLRTADTHQPLRFPGQEAEEFDPTQGPNGASARFYNGYRWYHPFWGRYTQPDPLGYAGSRYNLYTYAQNNPINFTDPLGLCDKKPAFCDLPAKISVGAFRAGLGIPVIGGIPGVDHAYVNVTLGRITTTVQTGPSGQAPIHSGNLVPQNYPEAYSNSNTAVTVSANAGDAYAALQAWNYFQQNAALQPIPYGNWGWNSNSFVKSYLAFLGLDSNLSGDFHRTFYGDQNHISGFYFAVPNLDGYDLPTGPDNPCE
jgi:RHS repeat-associated protein